MEKNEEIMTKMLSIDNKITKFSDILNEILKKTKCDETGGGETDPTDPTEPECAEGKDCTKTDDPEPEPECAEGEDCTKTDDPEPEPECAEGEDCKNRGADPPKPNTELDPYDFGPLNHCPTVEDMSGVPMELADVILERTSFIHADTSRDGLLSWTEYFNFLVQLYNDEHRSKDECLYFFASHYQDTVKCKYDKVKEIFSCTPEQIDKLKGEDMALGWLDYANAVNLFEIAKFDDIKSGKIVTQLYELLDKGKKELPIEKISCIYNIALGKDGIYYWHYTKIIYNYLYLKIEDGFKVDYFVGILTNNVWEIKGKTDPYDLGKIEDCNKVKDKEAQLAELIFERLSFIQIDTSGDGALDFDEFVIMMINSGYGHDIKSAEALTLGFFAGHRKKCKYDKGKNAYQCTEDEIANLKDREHPLYWHKYCENLGRFKDYPDISAAVDTLFGVLGGSGSLTHPQSSCMLIGGIDARVAHLKKDGYDASFSSDSYPYYVRLLYNYLYIEINTDLKSVWLAGMLEFDVYTITGGGTNGVEKPEPVKPKVAPEVDQFDMGYLNCPIPNSYEYPLPNHAMLVYERTLYSIGDADHNGNLDWFEYLSFLSRQYDSKTAFGTCLGFFASHYQKEVGCKVVQSGNVHWYECNQAQYDQLRTKELSWTDYADHVDRWKYCPKAGLKNNYTLLIDRINTSVGGKGELNLKGMSCLYVLPLGNKSYDYYKFTHVFYSYFYMHTDDAVKVDTLEGFVTSNTFQIKGNKNPYDKGKIDCGKYKDYINFFKEGNSKTYLVEFIFERILYFAIDTNRDGKASFSEFKNMLIKSGASKNDTEADLRAFSFYGHFAGYPCDDQGGKSACSDDVKYILKNKELPWTVYAARNARFGKELVGLDEYSLYDALKKKGSEWSKYVKDLFKVYGGDSIGLDEFSCLVKNGIHERIENVNKKGNGHVAYSEDQYAHYTQICYDYLNLTPDSKIHADTINYYLLNN